MSNLLSIQEVRDYLITKVNTNYTNMTANQIISDLISGLDEISPTTNLESITYNNRDIQDFRKYLIERVMEITDKWTDFNESDPGMAYIEVAAGLADMLGFYLDKQALECFITDVKQRKNGMSILKLINYKMHLTNSCVTTGRFVLPKEYDSDVIIPKYTQVSAILNNKDVIYYSTMEETVIPANTLQVDIRLVQGKVMKSYIPVSDLMKNSKVYILADDIAENSIQLVIDGKEWELVEDVVVDDVSGPKYSLYEDKDCKPYIQFQSDYLSHLPKNGSIQAELTYLVSLGPNGKIRAGAIQQVNSSVSDPNGIEISNEIEVTNISNATGGAERETLDEARLNGPNRVSNMGFAITLEDYKNICLEYPGVLKCSALDWTVEDSKYVGRPYKVDLYILPNTGDECSFQQLADIQNYFSGKMVSSMILEAKPVNFVDINISGTVLADINSSEIPAFKSKLTEYLMNKYNPVNSDFEQIFSPSNVISAIEEYSKLVRSVELDSPSSRIEMDKTQILRINSINLTIIKR